jgi:small subunit ribosomal protein S15
MTLTKEMRKEVITKHQKHAKDTATPAVQVALITERIKYLSDHLQAHKKDHHTRVGLLRLVGQRRRMLTYLKRTDLETYQKTIKSLELRK